jgi:hypothetical protein
MCFEKFQNYFFSKLPKTFPCGKKITDFKTLKSPTYFNYFIMQNKCQQSAFAHQVRWQRNIGSHPSHTWPWKSLVNQFIFETYFKIIAKVKCIKMLYIRASLGFLVQKLTSSGKDTFLDFHISNRSLGKTRILKTSRRGLRHTSGEATAPEFLRRINKKAAPGGAVLVSATQKTWRQ